MNMYEMLGFIMIAFAIVSVISIAIVKEELRRCLHRKDIIMCLFCSLTFSVLIGFGLMLCCK